jgi:diadenosine tetraphosphate (Ap4A) HIT family hydrolase
LGGLKGGSAGASGVDPAGEKEQPLWDNQSQQMPPPTAPCPFCNLPKERVWQETEHSIAFLDAFPVTEGHTLIIPKRHVESLFDLPEVELARVWAQVAEVRKLLTERYHPDGFNVGVNDGQAAGQTIAHAHVHVIPRREGDAPDPRGGIRWIVPGKAKYW